MSNFSRFSALITVLTALLLSACSSVPSPKVTPPEMTNMPAFPEKEPNGSIYQARRGFSPLFEDRRPRQIGDILTVVLNEEVSASKSSRANASRQGSASLELEQLPDALEALAEYGFDIGSNSEFNGAGGASANNTFTGTITVTVQDVLPNGNLLVTGERQIAINQGTEHIRLTGVVQPRSITTRNTVASTEVASARIEYLGDGYMNQAQRMGWLQRFFLTVSPF